MKYVLLFVLLFGCASKEVCPSEIEEPVSQCRANSACNTGSFWSSIGIALSGMGAGSSGKNQAADNMNRCIDRNLEAQRNNAGIQSIQQTCRTEKISDDEFKINCH